MPTPTERASHTSRLRGKNGTCLRRHVARVDRLLIAAKHIVLHPQVVNVLLESERQWCGDCQREVVARDERSLPFTEYGLNVFLVVMVLRFRGHASLHTIADVLQILVT